MLGLRGNCGLQRGSKSHPVRRFTVEKCVAKARRMGMREIEVHVRGAGAGRESSITAFEANGLSGAIEDHTPVPHNGCRPPKQRRV